MSNQSSDLNPTIDIFKKGKKNLQLQVHTNTHHRASLISAPLVAVKGLLMVQPYLCKSHFAVQSQWSIALSASPAPQPCICSASISRTASAHYLFRPESKYYFSLVSFLSESSAVGIEPTNPQ